MSSEEKKNKNCKRHVANYLNCISVANNWNHMIEETKFPICRENLTRFRNCLNGKFEEKDIGVELKEKMDKMPWEYKEDFIKKLFGEIDEEKNEN